MATPNPPAIRALRPARNKGRIVGLKRPLKPKHVWAIRVRLKLAENHGGPAGFTNAFTSRPANMRIVRDWVTSIGLEASVYRKHSMRRTKVTQIYKKTGNQRAAQLLLGHTKMDSTVRYRGVKPEAALAIAEPIEI
jgi:site-specific recombinase XerC